MAMNRYQPSDTITFEGRSTVVSLWAAQCEKYGERTCHRAKELGIWQAYSWRDYYDTAKQIGLALL